MVGNYVVARVGGRATRVRLLHERVLESRTDQRAGRLLGGRSVGAASLERTTAQRLGGLPRRRLGLAVVVLADGSMAFLVFPHLEAAPHRQIDRAAETRRDVERVWIHAHGRRRQL